MEPWRTRKENPEKCGNTLHVCLQLVAALSLLFEPVLPHKMKRLRSQLGVSEDLKWDEIDDGILPSGSSVSKGEILFNKIDDEVVEEQLNKLKEKAEAAQSGKETEYKPLKDEIQFDDFLKLDIRAGRITAAEKIKKADKLLKLTVDMGFEERTIVSGIAKHFEPEELTGQMVCVLANLPAKPLMGVESNGMILMAEEADGSLKFIETDAEPGSVIS